jgi:hypothetical protein
MGKKMPKTPVAGKYLRPQAPWSSPLHRLEHNLANVERAAEQVTWHGKEPWNAKPICAALAGIIKVKSLEAAAVALTA